MRWFSKVGGAVSSLSSPGRDPALFVPFYEYAHNLDPAVRCERLAGLKPLLMRGDRSPDSQFERHVERAIQAGHPEPEFLPELARVITGATDISRLDGFDCWKDALLTSEPFGQPRNARRALVGVVSRAIAGGANF